MLSVLALFLICSNLIAFFLGTILNVLVIYLCFRVTNIEINRMRWAIALAAIAELAVCTVLIGLQTGFEEMNGFPSIILLGFVVYFPNAIAFCFWESFLLLFVFRLISLPISFLHRYSIICGKLHLQSFFTPRKLTIVISISLMISVLICLISVPPIYLRKAFASTNEFRGVGEIYVMEFYTDLLWCVELFCAICCLMFAIAYAIIAYATIAIYKMLSANAIAPKTKALQKQLTLVMLLQAIMPLVFAAVPLLTFILIFFTGVQLQGYGSLAGTLLNWQPCVQAMSTLWFVTPFRKKITHKFTKRTAETTTNVNPTLRANAPRTLQVLSVKTHVSDCE